MKPGYSTNSLDGGDPLMLLTELIDCGCRSVAITPDTHLLNPYGSDFRREVTRWRHGLTEAGLACVIETGARHLLDSHAKHEPTLMSVAAADRVRRIDFLCRAIDLAVDLQADCVSFWSGVVRDAAGEEDLWDRLLAGMQHVLAHAERQNVRLGFEPEPGMFIDTVARAEQLLQRLGSPGSLGLTLDIGHLECLGEWPLAKTVRRVANSIVNVHVDDMLCCRHEHLPLGSGEVAFGPVLRELACTGYAGGLHLELPRQSHHWLATARQSLAFLHHELECL